MIIFYMDGKDEDCTLAEDFIACALYGYLAHRVAGERGYRLEVELNTPLKDSRLVGCGGDLTERA